MAARKQKLTREPQLSFQKYPWVKYITFPNVPILYFEAGCYSYENNPNHKLLGVKPPEVLSILGRSYEAWRVEETRVRITDSAAIKKIIKGNYEFVSLNRKIVSQILQKSIPDSPDKIIKIVVDLNKVSKGLYAWFTFFTDETFETKDKALLKELPEARLKISNFILKELFPVFEKILKSISSRYRIRRQALDRSTSDEIISLLCGRTGRDQIMKNAHRAALFAIHQGRAVTLFGKDASLVKKILEKQDPQKSKLLSKKLLALKNREFRGTPAFRGVAEGKVVKIIEEDFGHYLKIFKKYESILKGKSGFILVGTKTRPEIVPYIQKASAIVTDIGGITSHAAIVSRELKKPCVIGTEIATEVLNTGDFVEVNADKGVIKILSKKRSNN